MTTATDALTTPTTESVLADLERVRATRKDELDLPISMTRRQLAAYVADTEEIRIWIQHLRASPAQLDEATATRSRLVAARTRLLAAETALTDQLHAAPDHNLIDDRQESRRAWERQQALLASITTIRNGRVEFFNGQPALPMPLRELLTPAACPTCGVRPAVQWTGGLPALDEQIAEADAKIAEITNTVATFTQRATAWLAANPAEIAVNP